MKDSHWLSQWLLTLGCATALPVIIYFMFLVVRMTKEIILKHCKENKLYWTPYLNDVLYLHYKGMYTELLSEKFHYVDNKLCFVIWLYLIIYLQKSTYFLTGERSDTRRRITVHMCRYKVYDSGLTDSGSVLNLAQSGPRIRDSGLGLVYGNVCETRVGPWTLIWLQFYLMDWG